MLATLEAKLVGAFALLGILALTHFGAYEYGKSVNANKSAIVAAKQAGKTEAANAKNQGDANVSQTQYLADLQSVNDYYHANPVIRVRVVPGKCAMPITADNSKRSDDTASGQYASPYSPAETEKVAVRLYDLQERLRAAGVKIE